MNRVLWLVLLWPALATAWEEESALGFIVAHRALLQAQRAVVASYQPPSLTRRVLEPTSLPSTRPRASFWNWRAACWKAGCSNPRRWSWMQPLTPWTRR